MEVHRWIRSWLLLILQARHTSSKFVAAAMLPHGDVAFDPSFLKPGTAAREAADNIAKSSREAARWFTDQNDLDLIFLSTPHGIQLTHDFGIYLGERASGRINITGDGKDHEPYEVYMPPITLDGALSLNLVTELTSSKHFNVSGIATSADGSRDLPLEWAEIIPLMLMPENKRHVYNYILWSYPLQRYTQSPEMVPELVHVGSYLRDWFEQIPERIGVLISGDMSHTHQASGPYGFSNASEIFDRAVQSWVCHPCKVAARLLDEARALQPDAKSCGFTGMVLLYGILCGNRHWPQIDSGRVFVNRNATYYGMMAATFALSDDADVASGM